MKAPSLPGGSNTAYYIGGGILALVILYLIFRDRVDSAAITASGYEFDTDPGALDNNKVLRKGSRGAEVAALQSDMVQDGANLGSYGPAGDGVDGVFGAKTEAELVRLKGVTAISINAYAAAPLAAAGATMGGRDQLYGNLAEYTGGNTGVAGNLDLDA